MTLPESSPRHALVLAILALPASLAACRDRPRGALATTRAHADATPAPRPAVPPAHPAGQSPCQGRRAGEAACDGRAVVRCGEGDAAPAPIATCADIERCDAERGACVPACPAGEVYVPATGPEGFTMGRGKEPYGFGPRKSGNEGHGIADTPHVVVLTKPFCMDALEATVGDYTRCVAEHGCTAPDFRTHWIVYPDKTDYPVNMIDWRQAKHYCASVGKDLPTEAQWEWAATGNDRRRWPWGDAPPTCELADFMPGDMKTPACDCGCNGGGASPVGTHPHGDKVWPSGAIHDLAGNVWEWCIDNYAPYAALPATDPVYVTSEAAPHVVRGGGWNRSAVGLMTSFRGTAIVEYQRPSLGVRCVRNPG